MILNIDFGKGKGTPDARYGAAGPAGNWNTIDELGLTENLVDASGNLTSVSIFTDGTGANGGTGANEICPCSDQQALLSDNFWKTGGGWSLTVQGLAQGVYDVYLYAPSHKMQTGFIDIEGMTLNSLPGGIGSFDEGVNWRLVQGLELDGTLAVSNAVGGGTWTGLAGLQIVGVPAPATGVVFVIGLVCVLSSKLLVADLLRRLSPSCYTGIES